MAKYEIPAEVLQICEEQEERRRQLQKHTTNKPVEPPEQPDTGERDPSELEEPEGPSIPSAPIPSKVVDEGTRFLCVDDIRIPRSRIAHTFEQVIGSCDPQAKLYVLDDSRCVLDSRASGRPRREFILLDEAVDLLAQSGIAVPADLLRLVTR